MLSSSTQALNHWERLTAMRWAKLGQGWSQAREQRLQVETGTANLTQTAQPARQAGLWQEAH